MLTGDLVADVARTHSLLALLDRPDGGFTVDPRSGEGVYGGYAVAIHPDCCAVLAEITLGDVLEFLLRHADTLALPGRVLGAWRDPADGRIYLDVSILVEDREQALALAREYDQLAVFDFSTGESIRTY
jgi:hypothetical protein